jgi:uncharacterized membrane protein
MGGKSTVRRAKDFRDIAWNTLRGRYWWAVLAALIAMLLGGYYGQPSFNFRFSSGDFQQFYQHAQQAFDGQFDPQAFAALARPFVGIAAAFGSLAFFYSLGLFIVGSAVELGYSLFNISLYGNKSAPKIETLFSRFSIFGNALLLRFLMALKIFLWMLLLIVPGIVAAYRYAMAPYLLAEHPELTASEAIERSKQMMAGNKGRLFCLHFSFIGWILLALLTWGVGFFFLAPYTKAAETAFYLDLTGRLLLEPAVPAAPGAPVTPDAPTLGEGETSGKEFI